MSRPTAADLRALVKSEVSDAILESYLKNSNFELGRAAQAFRGSFWGLAARKPNPPIEEQIESTKNENLEVAQSTKRQKLDHSEPKSVVGPPPCRPHGMFWGVARVEGIVSSQIDMCNISNAVEIVVDLEISISRPRSLTSSRRQVKSQPPVVAFRYLSSSGLVACESNLCSDVEVCELPTFRLSASPPFAPISTHFKDKSQAPVSPKRQSAEGKKSWGRPFSSAASFTSKSSAAASYALSPVPEDRLSSIVIFGSLSPSARFNINNRSVGKLSTTEAAILAPLVSLNLIELEARVGRLDDVPNRKFSLGDCIPLEVSVWVNQKIFQSNLLSKLAPECQAVMASCWNGLIQLLVGHLSMTSNDKLADPTDDGETADEPLVDDGDDRTDEFLGTDFVGNVNINPINPQIEIFRSTLREYQKFAVGWMSQAEIGTREIEMSQEDFTLPTPWRKYLINCDESKFFFFNPSSGALTITRPVRGDCCLGGILADEMGLGKTVEVLGLASLDFGRTVDGRLVRDFREKAVGDLPLGGTLLVLPLTLMNQWKAEIEKHFQPLPLIIMSYYGNERKNDLTNLAAADFVLTTYGTVQAEWKSHHPPPLEKIFWHRIVLDEGHIIKSRVTRTCRAVCSLEGERRWCLTGTPIQNSLEDVFSLFLFLRFRPWDNWLLFSKEVVEPMSKGKMPLAIDNLRNLIQPIILRRTKATRDSLGRPIVELPPITVTTEVLEMSSDERDFYDALFHRVSKRYKSFVAGGRLGRQFTAILQLVLRLRQACCHPLLIFSRGGMRTLLVREDDEVQMDKLVSKFLENCSINKSPDPMPSRQFIENQIQKLISSDEKKESECPVCFDILDLPVMAACCHPMCRECMIKVIRQNQTCPICRSVLREEGLQFVGGSSSVVLELLKGSPNFIFSTKLKFLNLRIAEDLANNLRIVVFSQWTSFFDFIQIMFDNSNVPYRRFDGTMSLDERSQVVAWFEGAGAPAGRVILVSLKAGGVGLNLVAGSRAYLTDLWWNPATEDQAIQRLHRLGQTKPVVVTRLVMKNSVEERIVALQLTKDHQARLVLSKTKVDQLLETNKLGLRDLQTFFEDPPV